MKKYLLISLVILISIGAYVSTRPAEFTMKPVTMNAAEIAEEMPEILLTEEDQAMQERLLSDPDLSAAIASADDTSFFNYPLDQAQKLLADWLAPEWSLTNLAYTKNTILLSVTMNDTTNLHYQFVFDGTSGPHKVIGIYDIEEPFRNIQTMYHNDNGNITKEVRTRIWF